MKFAAAFFGIVLSGCAPALKDVKPSLSTSDAGTIWFATTGRVVREKPNLLKVAADPVVLSGELQFPAGAGPFPAVVLAHGCGGPGNADANWAIVLREWGYATLVLDSFRGRGLREVCSAAQTLTATQRIPDAYGALRALATHPRIDARRIALMGFSHGAQLTVAASTTWARNTFAADGKPAFRGFFAFYPFCNMQSPELEDIYAPLRIHSGELDNWTPATPCVDLVQKLRTAGKDAAIVTYPGAHHSFDNLGTAGGYLPNVENYGGCFWKSPSILGPFSGALIAECMKRGATIGYNDAATRQAQGTVREQLTQLLKP